MNIARTFIFFIFLLPGCALLGSESYFAAGTHEGKPEWTGKPGTIHITGKPDAVRYRPDGIDFTVYASPLSSRTYSIGPCLPVPLPVIPLFGLDGSEHDGPVQITFHVLQSKKQHQLIRAVLVTDDRSFSPTNITAGKHPGGDGTAISPEAFLPLSLIDRSAYVLTYDLLRSAAAGYELVFYLQGDSGTIFFKDKISFTREHSTTFRCVFP